MKVGVLKTFLCAAAAFFVALGLVLVGLGIEDLGRGALVGGSILTVNIALMSLPRWSGWRSQTH